ncbi:YbbN family protein [Acidihalobacter prosperus]|uniref:Thioredoxin domain-containing protein n=1 Tax=Acidihalobacter prosperus TaxID=160660 RepID=A0A1A6C1K3_9GAMM|nr:thioredoxin family protein [Acidihalobacter prosperus]OBS08425.1 hypothetical protein Thpro_022675 [Acidihalobacter prosperus]
MSSRLRIAVLTLFCMTPTAQGLADVTTLPIKALPAYLESHTDVVVQFTSPDPGCVYCVHANAPFQAVSTRFDQRISFVRVQWAPWYRIPAEAKPFGIIALPAQIAFKQGARVHTQLGVIAQPARFAEQISKVYDVPQKP